MILRDFFLAVMRFFPPRTALPLLFIFCLPAVSQDVRVVRIGVALLSSSSNKTPAAEARDQLVEDLNHHQIDQKKNHINKPAATFSLGSEESAAQDGVLADLAYGTGGIFFHNNNDLEEGLRRASARPEYVYVLGFAPQRLDGKFHKLKVTLKGAEKLTVQARPGYYALKPAAAN